MATTTIYVLRLKNGKYYVGQTNDLVKRYLEHKTGLGAEWTRKYEPLGFERIKNFASPFDEDKFVKEYMLAYGVDEVRGGSYSQMVLNDAQKKAIEIELRTAEGSCVRCGRMEHSSETCHVRTDVDGYDLTPLFAEPKKKEKGTCYTCGRNSHYAPHCFAKTHLKGYVL